MWLSKIWLKMFFILFFVVRELLRIISLEILFNPGVDPLSVCSLLFRNSSEKFRSLESSEKCWKKELAISRVSVVVVLFLGLSMARICLIGLRPQKRLMLPHILDEGFSGCMVDVKELEASLFLLFISNLYLAFKRL